MYCLLNINLYFRGIDNQLKKTIMKYTVTSEINTDVENFNTKQEVKEYIKSELKFYNYGLTKNLYTEEDFIITNNQERINQ